MRKLCCRCIGTQEQAKQEQLQQQQALEQQQQQQQQAEEEPLTELQEQLLLCYRKTFLVAGLGLIGSMWRWNMVTKHNRKDIFLPPRAQALPKAVSGNVMCDTLQCGSKQRHPLGMVMCLAVASQPGRSIAATTIQLWPLQRPAGQVLLATPLLL
jgi:hypothetical protein